jgi:hypothetical protein
MEMAAAEIISLTNRLSGEALMSVARGEAQLMSQHCQTGCEVAPEAGRFHLHLMLDESTAGPSTSPRSLCKHQK